MWLPSGQQVFHVDCGFEIQGGSSPTDANGDWKDKKLSLRLFAPNYERGKSFVQYGSRKGDTESRPQLLVTTLP